MTSAAAVVFAVVVGLGEAKDPSTVALVSAARDSLPEGSVVRVVEKVAPNAVNAVSLERELGVGATFVVTWKDARRQHALVRVHLPATDLWFSQEMEFSPMDTAVERGRTLGLVAASIWPDPGRARRPPLPTAPTASAAANPVATSSPPEPRPVTGPRADERRRAEARSDEERSEQKNIQVTPDLTLSDRWVQEPRSTSRQSPEVALADHRETADAQAQEDEVLPEVLRREGAGDMDGTARRSSLPPEPARPHTFALELNSVASTGFGHPAEGLGAALRGMFFPVSLGLAISAGVGGRFGRLEIDGSSGDARDLEAQLALGVEWWPGDRKLRSGVDEARQTWALGLRVEALAVYSAVTDSKGQNKSLILPGGEALGQLRLRLASRLHLLAAAGVEGIAGEIVIRRWVGDTLVEKARIASVRAVGEIGLRVRF